MKKINMNKDHRLKEINKMALMIQDTKLKSLSEIRRIAESIEILSDDKILKSINSSIEDIKHGRFTTIENIKKS